MFGSFIKFGFVAILFCVCQFVFCGELKTSVFPSRLTLGSYGTFQIILNSRSSIQRPDFPQVDGIEWLNEIGTSSEFSMINGKTTVKTVLSCSFIAAKEGEWKIPSFKVKVGKKTMQTEPVQITISKTSAKIRNKVTAGSSEGANSPGEIVFSSMSLSGNEPQKKYYAGEEIPLSIDIYVRAPFTLGLSRYPDIRSQEGMTLKFKDYRKENPQAPNYEQATYSSENVSGTRYTVYHFNTRFRPLTSGKLTLTASADVQISEGTGFFDRTVARKRISDSLDTINIFSLPENKTNASFCGLVGTWTVSAAISGGPYRVAEPLTLKLKFHGNGADSTLNTPVFDLPGFRCYPPEKKITANGIELRYTLIPLSEGEQDVSISLSTFDTKTGKYQPFEFRKTILTEKARIVVKTIKTVIDSGNVPAASANVSTQKVPNDILYLHKNFSHGIQLPLWRNTLILNCSLILVGVLVFLLALTIYFRRRVLNSNPALLRKMSAKDRKKALLKKIKLTMPEDLTVKLNAELAEYLNDMLNLPQGATLTEAAEQIEERNPELSAVLKKLSELSWMPDTKKALNQELKEKLIHGISKLSVIVLLFGSFTLSAYSAEPVKTVPDSVETAMNAYDSGNFEGAMLFWKKRIEKGSERYPDALYNLGNCYYQMGEYANALVCYERASRLAPRDSDVLGNLNLTRKKLLLPEKYKIEHPGDILVSIRDSFRYDEWLTVCAVSFLLLMIALSMRLLKLGVLWKYILLSGIILGVCAVFAIRSQSSSLLSSAQAVVIRRNAPLYTLPSERSGKIELYLKPGQEVSIEERRLEWCRIRVDRSEGWLRSDSLASLLPE